MDAIVKPFGGKHTPKSCMFTSVAWVLPHKHKERGINKEMKGWRVKEKHTPSSLMEMMMKNRAVMNDLRHRLPRPLWHRNHAQGVLVVFMLARQEKKKIQG